MELSKNALTVLERRYLMKNGEGVVIETVEELFRRVAGAIAASDRRYDENADCEALADSFYRMMTNLEFLPNSPTLMNAGRPLGQLSACFVLPVEDTMEGIFSAHVMRSPFAPNEVPAPVCAAALSGSPTESVRSWRSRDKL